MYGHWTKEDDAHSAGLYKACGVVRIARTELELSAEETNPTARNFALQRKVRYTICDGSIKPHNSRLLRACELGGILCWCYLGVNCSGRSET